MQKVLSQQLSPPSTICQMSVLAEFCWDHLASKTHFLPLEDREEQTSFVQRDLGECLLVVGLRDVFAWPTFERHDVREGLCAQ